MRFGSRTGSLVGGLLVVLAVLLAGCTKGPENGTSTPSSPDAAIAALIQGLETGDVSKVPWGGDLTKISDEYHLVTDGLEGLYPKITVGKITNNSGNSDRTVELNQTYSLNNQVWQFTTKAKLTSANGDWAVSWNPNICYPELDGYTRLGAIIDAPARGKILDDTGDAMVWNRPVYHVGIDKTKADASQWDSSARALAAMVGVDPDTFAKAVAAGGPQQFVVAVTLRQGDVPEAITTIPGAYAQPDTMSLGPTATFAQGLLGSATEATAEDIQKSDGKIKQGTVIGRSGLQARYNTQLTGSAGMEIFLVPRSEDKYSTPDPDQRVTSTPLQKRKALFTFNAINGADVPTTLDVGLQQKAESVLASQTGVASFVALDVKTGAILAAADSPAANGYSYATLGQYPPGSTFKLSTTLALLRSGMTLDSPINCPETLQVGNTSYHNVSGYDHTGMIPLRDAVAYSCNTAMAGGAEGLPADALTNAAASLGVGADWDRGFDAFYGKVPPATDVATRAADGFGQGDVLASPMAMAGEIASVASGQTIVPYLISGPVTGGTPSPVPSESATGPASPAGQSSGSGPSQSPATSEATETPSQSATESASPSAAPTTWAPQTPLTATEAAELQQAAQAVVDHGTGTTLKGLVIGAKSGSAEFERDGQTLVHAWMIAYTDKYAMAAFVDVGQYGSTTAAPLIKAFLS